jgi:hypothetical protein
VLLVVVDVIVVEVDVVVVGPGSSSSSTMVTWAWPSAMVAPTGLVRFRRNISSASLAPSSSTVTVTCFDVSPGAKVTVVGASAV